MSELRDLVRKYQEAWAEVHKLQKEAWDINARLKAAESKAHTYALKIKWFELDKKR